MKKFWMWYEGLKEPWRYFVAMSIIIWPVILFNIACFMLGFGWRLVIALGGVLFVVTVLRMRFLRHG